MDCGKSAPAVKVVEYNWTGVLGVGIVDVCGDPDKW